jgi:hypothetical protein
VSHQGADDDEKSVRRSIINTRTEDMVNGAGLNWLFFLLRSLSTGSCSFGELLPPQRCQKIRVSVATNIEVP